MKHLHKLFIIILLALCANVTAQDDILQSKSRPTLVNDEASLFSASQKAELERMLVAYDDSTSTQIAVVTVESLNGYDPGDYAARMGEQWGIGRKDKDNGIVILIKPRIGNERGQVYIATGYGVEHILTDARVGRIIDNYMIPYLPDDYFTATKTAALIIIQMLSGEFQADEDDMSELAGSIIVAIILFGVIVYAVTKSSKNDNWPNDKNSGGSRGPTYYPTMGRGFGRSTSGGRPSGGGGFGGFGGGRFGGGGAGRSF